MGSYFENLSGRSQRLEGTATLYVPAKHWAGQHDVRAGLDVDHVAYNQKQTLAPVSYSAGERDSMLRQSTFAAEGPFVLHNSRLADTWRTSGSQRRDGWLSQECDSIGTRLCGDRWLRREWPQCMRRGAIGQNEDLRGNRALLRAHATGVPGSDVYRQRNDTFYQADGVTPTGPAQATEFTENEGSLHEARALNWSVGVERELPWKVFASANFIEKELRICLRSRIRMGRARWLEIIC